MSILIKGMNMPKSCYDCPLAMQDYTTLFGNNFKQTRNSYACVLTHKVITSTKRNRFCPLITVPSHGKLIDVDKVLDELSHKLGIRSLDYLTPSERAIVSWFRTAPTIIEAEEGET